MNDAGDRELRELMARYQGGEIDAFEAVYGRTFALVRGYLTTLLRDRERAVDLAQEAFLQVHRSRHTYDPAYPVTPWLLGIARHVWSMDRRRTWRRESHEETGLDTAPEVAVPAAMESLGTRDAVSRALAALNADRREAVVLHHVYGFSFREIGAVAGVTETAARVRAHRGMSELRAALKGAR